MQRISKKMIGWLIAILIIAAAFFVPLPEYIEGPGSADNLRQFVTIKGYPDRRAGKFMLTSVALAQATPLTWLYAQVMPHYSTVSKDEVTGGQNNKTYNKVQTFYMHGAINEAIATAYQAAHKTYHKQYQGIYVLSVAPQSHFKKAIQVGDTIVKVNGHHFNNKQGYQNYVAKQGLNKTVVVQYQHAGKLKQASGKLMKITSNRAGIGVTLTDNVTVNTKIPVKVDPGQIGGPSAGLMFSLQIYQQLTNENLRHGRKIAGTGTIEPDGTVGEIGGIDKKIIAAKRAGATVFFAPYVKSTKAVLAIEGDGATNYQVAKRTAKRYAPNMKIVPVKTFQDALNYLKSH